MLVIKNFKDIADQFHLGWWIHSAHIHPLNSEYYIISAKWDRDYRGEIRIHRIKDIERGYRCGVWLNGKEVCSFSIDSKSLSDKKFFIEHTMGELMKRVV